MVSETWDQTYGRRSPVWVQDPMAAHWQSNVVPQLTRTPTSRERGQLQHTHDKADSSCGASKGFRCHQSASIWNIGFLIGYLSMPKIRLFCPFTTRPFEICDKMCVASCPRWAKPIASPNAAVYAADDRNAFLTPVKRFVPLAVNWDLHRWTVRALRGMALCSSEHTIWNTEPSHGAVLFSTSGFGVSPSNAPIHTWQVTAPQWRSVSCTGRYVYNNDD